MRQRLGLEGNVGRGGLINKAVVAKPGLAKRRYTYVPPLMDWSLIGSHSIFAFDWVKPRYINPRVPFNNAG